MKSLIACTLLCPWSKLILGHLVNQEIPRQETESLLLYSQEPATVPCPEPDESIPELPTQFLEDPY
jgi:hypothetical protein